MMVDPVVESERGRTRSHTGELAVEEAMDLWNADSVVVVLGQLIGLSTTDSCPQTLSPSSKVPLLSQLTK